jgi:hypothetical protein
VRYGQDDVRRQRDQFRRVCAQAVGIALGAPAKVDPHVPADRPAPRLQALYECSIAELGFRIVRRKVGEHADAPHAVRLLRACGRLRGYRRTEPCDELPPSHRSSPELLYKQPTARRAAWKRAKSRQTAYRAQGRVETGQVEDNGWFGDRIRGLLAAAHESLVGPVLKSL